ncbi:hypothetical protein [Stieleria neptunia]|uniref:hypothetical protein n=1 Tax=Stieleria neptunia TaxID=2527979 RepID=UPI0018D23A5E|nr:hypothetical protein [Stieleria neptunia]
MVDGELNSCDERPDGGPSAGSDLESVYATLRMLFPVFFNKPGSFCVDDIRFGDAQALWIVVTARMCTVEVPAPEHLQQFHWANDQKHDPRMAA